ncbi:MULTISPECIES: SOS response-associated peptidase [Rhizobium]|uniref:Abasic site processing protein n=2 Tax=Rhizobium TaxID=379 RepID=A0A3S3XR06_RHILE|nr:MULTISPECIES: SOS response-associated peptidase [Rhizobium]MBY2944213.1 SOS response-associated peptidase [Rhizobium leguminosarum]MBY5458946.1 SOS response-associated peptidase [Rhizobium leguminosarum]RWX25968.1 SOS response-associated peptidase [Rhizobium leguminosarum]RWY63756.1 SOS response-associated peptidase [Rhizobium leguminosarum]TAU52056.1 SOS response-associated peptidase [Rhizobium leguminosarum]
MCGRVYIKTSLEELVRNFAFAERGAIDALGNRFPRYNGAPTLDYPIIIRDMVREPDIMGPVFASARWGLMPAWMKPGGRPPPINARCEGIATNGLFRSAYRSRRCLVPINGFFEWKDIFGTGKNKQPYAIAMADGSPFALAGIWEIWRSPEGVDVRNFAIVTCEPNAMMAQIHDRMPVVLHREDYERWLSPEPDPTDLMKPFPAELMTMWPIGRNVGSPKNDTADIIDPIDPDPEPTLI